jgi:hypothetical protein
MHRLTDEFTGPAGLAREAKLSSQEDYHLSNDNRHIKRHGSSEYKRHGHVPNEAMDNVKLTNAIPSTRNVWNATVVRQPTIEVIETKKKKTKRKRKKAVTRSPSDIPADPSRPALRRRRKASSRCS